MQAGQVKRVYYTIMATYVFWTFVCATLFLFFSKPKVMVLVIANLNNVGLGFTAFFILWNNHRLLPKLTSSPKTVPGAVRESIRAAGPERILSDESETTLSGSDHSEVASC